MLTCASGEAMTALTIFPAFIAAVTAIFVAAVGYLQWRTAHQKAVLDLYDRRRAIFDVVASSVAQMISSSPGFDLQRLAEFQGAKEQAYFFFGDDVQTYLDRLSQDILDVRSADDELKGPLELPDRGQTVKLRSSALKRISEFPKTGKPIFGKYMRFPQPVRQDLPAWIGASLGRLRVFTRYPRK
jgi:hypothetical protein